MSDPGIEKERIRREHRKILVYEGEREACTKVV